MHEGVEGLRKGGVTLSVRLLLKPREGRREDLVRMDGTEGIILTAG